MPGTTVLIAGCTILVLTPIPIAHIAIGAVYVHECPVSPFIPVYVMVSGILALLVMGLIGLPKLLCPAATSNKMWTVSILSLFLFVLIWFIYGSYQTYSAYPPNYAKITRNPKGFNNSITPSVALNNTFRNYLQSKSQSLPNLNPTGMINNQTSRKPIQTSALSIISSETSREHLNTPPPPPPSPPPPPPPRVMYEVPYCDRTVYLFAFWTTTLVYVCAANALVITVCLYGCLAIKQNWRVFQMR